MPQVGYDSLPSSTIDLASVNQNQQRIDMAKRQESQQNMQQIMSLVQQVIQHQQTKNQLKNMGLIDSKGNVSLEGLKNLPQGTSMDLTSMGLPMQVKSQDPYDQILKQYMIKQLNIAPETGTVSPKAVMNQPQSNTINPDTLSAYRSVAKQGGVNIVGGKPGATEIETLNMLNKMFQAKGLTPPATPQTPAPMSTIMPPQQPIQSNLGTPEIGLSATGKPTLKFKSPSATSTGVTPQQDIIDSVKGAFDGTVPPERLASWRDVTRVNAEIKRQSEKNAQSFPDLMLEWDATKKFVTSAQSTQQIRLRQAIDFAQRSTKDLKKLSQEFKRSNFPIVNKAQLTLAMNGGLGQENAKRATIFNQQLTDIVADLANVYMGGNSPTDEGLRLAQQNLQSNWSIKQLDAAIDNVDKLLTFRGNAIKTAAPMFKGQYGTKYYGQPQIGEQDNDQYQVGQTIQKNGKTYTYKGNGQWSF